MSGWSDESRWVSEDGVRCYFSERAHRGPTRLECLSPDAERTGARDTSARTVRFDGCARGTAARGRPVGYHENPAGEAGGDRHRVTPTTNTGQARARVLLADDHADVAEQLRDILEPEFEVVATVKTAPPSSLPRTRFIRT